MDLFYKVQELVFDYADNLDDEEFVNIVDSYVFSKDKPDNNATLRNFLEYCSCLITYENHLIDLNDGGYFLKCSGSDLKYLEMISTSLLVSSYNRLSHKVKGV
jgi:hypothetical protein